jgi:hypothetical protein
MPLLNEENSEKCMPETNIAPNSKDNKSSPVRNVHRLDECLASGSRRCSLKAQERWAASCDGR